MNNYELAKAQAEILAFKDWSLGKASDPARHGARLKSAFATWYISKFNQLNNQD
jgi:hypothetical protein